MPKPPREALSDPSGIEEPHDVLAAEEFAIPTADADTPQARAARALPADPSGIKEPHDVLVPEDFAIPAGGSLSPPLPPSRSARGRVGAAALVAGLALAAVLRRRS